jgi:N-acetylglucosamine-6-phosphate deacetylase
MIAGSHARWLAVAATFFVPVIATAAPPGTTAPAPGLRENTPAIHALVGARIVVAPGKVIEKGTVVVRDGLITAVGAEVNVPKSARLWDLSGKTLYAGFIDAYSELSADAPSGGETVAGYWNSAIAPETRAERIYRFDKTTNEKLRQQGIAVRLVAPGAQIIRGTSALYTTGEQNGTHTLYKDGVALHLKLTTRRRGMRDENYPTSPMGAFALVRQAFYDAKWYADACEVHRQKPLVPQPERNTALETLVNYLDGKGLVIIDAADDLYFLRADQVAKEFNLNTLVRGSGEEYQMLEAVKATGRAVLLPVNFPKAPNVKSPEAALSVSLGKLMHWDLAPENPARLDKAGVKIALTTDGLKDVSTFLPAVRKAVKHGLAPEAALRALTVTPATLLGIADRTGTLEVNKAAHFVVTDGDLFDKTTKIVETWVSGHRYESHVAPLADLRGTWEAVVAKADGGSETLTLKLAGEPEKLSGSAHRGDKEAKLTHVALEGAQLSATFKADTLGWDGAIQLSGTLVDTDDTPVWEGYLLWADGKKSSLAAKRTALVKADAKPTPKDGDKEKKEGDKETADVRPGKALYEVNFPLGEYGRSAKPEQPKAVLFQHATTIWTSGPQGNLTDADVLVEAGKITAVGKSLAVPAGATVIDCRGKHLSPGIIDCHSHIATDGGINEAGQTNTAEVRIGDFIDPKDINIYRQLAGGVTAANILHGSANTIGGQCQLIKFRWGALPEEMKFAEAPPSIKFALGENVKQSNWGERFKVRYPQTRMGVEQLLRDAFNAGVEYRRRWNDWRRTKNGLPPRVDLELEALTDVVYGRRWIHCHSYRQDEILAFLRVCEDFNVRVSTLQHILEGYKVADVMAQHGVGGSSFSDWWAYKFEVMDAIPYNGALMQKAGVLVSFNSDDAELARRLNTEAAKAVKYGSVPEVEALKFVTYNTAKQLGVDKQVGSLEPGKDADLVVWSGSPLSTLSRCEQTWVDGRKYFDQAADREQRKEIAQRRAALIQRVLLSGDPTEGPDDNKKDLWPREDIFCHDHDDHDHGHE